MSPRTQRKTSSSRRTSSQSCTKRPWTAKLAAGLLYSRTGDRVLLLATSVFPEFRGKGVAARLLGGVLDSLRKDNMTATVSCPFAAAYIRAHPEYADIVDARFPGNPHGHHH
ncbi:GNAT family N-acetyltransferase [Microbacterium aurum]|uniref:GNAT family N-acetyltransferase n=1 Tax=Microbacterium aurum TaxID=36805 RepID=UPI0023B7DA9E|nr:GNAT family N-acetyltransferase [Microbacterium aurum]